MKKSWSVELTDEAEKELRTNFKTDKITSEDVKVIKHWIVDVEEQGLAFAQRKAAGGTMNWMARGKVTARFRFHIPAGLFIGSRMRKLLCG